jgi:hypothetical protein
MIFRQFLLALGFVIWFPVHLPAQTEKPRESHPLAPSLPLLTEKEEEKVDDTVDRFIQYDMGQLRGEEGRKALKEFRELGPETIPGLIRGLNRAAKIESSCPAVTIAKKLAVMLRASNDPDLLEFARENVGAGITQSRHMGVIRDLKMVCIMRKRSVGSNVVARDRPRQEERPVTLTIPDSAPEETRVLQTKGKYLREAAQRGDDQALVELAHAASSKDKDTRQLGQELLTQVLSAQDAERVKEAFKNKRAIVRSTAARVAGDRQLPFGAELINLLSDEDSEVREAAHQVLVRLNGNKDFGPSADSNDAERSAAIKKWREWWAKKN